MMGFKPFMMEAFKAIANPTQQPNGKFMTILEIEQF